MTRFDKIVTMFAKWGFIETPLTASQIDQLITWNWNDDAIYQIGCDCHNGFRFNEVLKDYQHIDVHEPDLGEWWSR